jgi:hypothetical protein
MSSSEEHVGTECPCYKCITYAVCQNKEFQPMMNDCKLLYEYLYREGKFGNTMMLDSINLYLFCKIMGIDIKETLGSFIIIYKWQR